MYSHKLWQNDTAIAKNSWGYTEGNQFKTPALIIRNMIEVFSKNGCYMLNVGPKADGTICEEEKNVLLEIGKWLEVNGEAYIIHIRLRSVRLKAKKAKTVHLRKAKNSLKRIFALRQGPEKFMFSRWVKPFLQTLKLNPFAEQMRAELDILSKNIHFRRRKQ